MDIANPAYLKVRHKQLWIEERKGDTHSLPIEDLGVLILEDPAIVITQAALVACQEANIAVVICDRGHLPFSLILPMTQGHSLHAKILRQQVQLKLTNKKRLWQRIVRQKIKEQALTLTLCQKDAEKLYALIPRVRSGDSQNHEAQAAKIYWPLLFGSSFKRDVDGEGINALLNYGYAIIRALIARAIVAGGFHPALGLHHHNQYNGYALADDLMEPFRPWIDFLVFRSISDEQLEGSSIELTSNIKKHLLSLLSENVVWLKQTMPLLVASHYFVAQLKRAYQHKEIKLYFPELETRK